MSDVMSVLAAAYKSSALTSPPSKTKYVAVDPKLYEGNWTGKYANNKSFTISVSDVSGFHAKVKYQSEGTVKYQDVLIKDKAFRIGDTATARPRSRTSSPIRPPARPISTRPMQPGRNNRAC
jgi:hypothetical protein